MTRNTNKINDFLLDYIFSHTEDTYLDIEDLGLAWTWYNDEGEDCGTSRVIALTTDLDKNLDMVAKVVFNDRNLDITTLDYYDVLGNNFANYLYTELS